ncbi:MAG: DUF2778 domain-containing protein [Bradyrhizobium sp.]|nr:MAG: DUF2778 domain-containing protein [Bradyrhizobium sp.]
MAPSEARIPFASVAPLIRPDKNTNPYGGLVAFDVRPANPYGALVDDFSDRGSASSGLGSALLASLAAPPVAAIPAAIPQIPEQAPATPLPPQRDVAMIDDAPLIPSPPARPAEFGVLAALTPAPAPRPSPAAAAPVAPAAAPLESAGPVATIAGRMRAPNVALAYATPGDDAGGIAKSPALDAMDRASGTSSFARSTPSPAPDGLTAIYDISARTVYLPDGTRLEAHSGLGDKLDDPRFVAEHDRGATPPHLYDLELRGPLFHGVQALRLDPVGGDSAVFGRSGLLAHTYMLGPNGDSNGCVSFKDYDAFLRAYQEGRVKHLVVVARLD